MQYGEPEEKALTLQAPAAGNFCVLFFWRPAPILSIQIRPVVSAPEVLVQHFCKRHKVTNPLFSPLASSAQALAGESNELGTYLDLSVASTWVGAPLRVHRRCVEPMSSIANTIAYSGLMTYGTR